MLYVLIVTVIAFVLGFVSAVYLSNHADNINQHCRGYIHGKCLIRNLTK